MTRLLNVEDLTIAYGGGDHWTEVVHGVTFDIRRGETLGFVGESGSGKSTVAYRLLCYRSSTSRVDRGKVVFDGRDVLSLDTRSLRGLRGKRIALVPQNPTSALSPAMRIHAQLKETIAAHDCLPPSVSMDDRIAELLALVGLPDARRIGRRYPHELSGGQQQRVAIAMAISCDPDLLVLDEPTTGLDVTTQRQIVNLLTSLRDRTGMAMFYVTHDLALLAQIADRIGVMYAGNLVEIGPAAELLSQPVHVYTRKLIASIPRIDDAASQMPEAQASAPLLSLKNVDLGYRAGGNLGSLFHARTIPIAADIDFDVRQGEIVAVVGESGSGKSTIARAIAGQLGLQSGSIHFDGELLEGSVARRPLSKLRAIQYIFQNPDSSLNPRRRIRQILLRPLRHFGLGGDESILREMLRKVRLKSDYLDRFPRQLSGGECQRIAIARALVVNPRLLICDEILSALDVSVQSSVLEVLAALRENDAVSILFISHDLAVVRQFADRVVVLYSGRVMQAGSVGEIFNGSQHPYTAMLLAAVPRLQKDEYDLPAPSAIGPRSVEKRGCPFAGRCPRQIGDKCVSVMPPRQATASGYLRCHIPAAELKQQEMPPAAADIRTLAV